MAHKIHLNAVIGANFGDEGKGLVTAKLTKRYVMTGKRVINVLTNGGSQRGHTVEYEDKRHVFHHYGSGTFFGAVTCFSEDFLINPMVFREERNELIKMGQVAISCICPVTARIVTPFDMILNQMKEENRRLRNGTRHGSCGQGIYETIRRYDRFTNNTIGIEYKASYNLFYANYDSCIYILQKIRDFYFIPKIKEEEIADNIREDWEPIYMDEELIRKFVDDLFYFRRNVSVFDIRSFYQNIAEYDEVIFENGQGLLLDQDNITYYPHLTPSDTGSRGIVRFCEKLKKLVPEVKFSGIHVGYVSRTYLTRHGDGPMETELSKEKLGLAMEDETNQPNEHQGRLRYGLIDPTLLKESITKDHAIIQRANHKQHLFDDSDILVDLIFTHANETNGLVMTSGRSTVIGEQNVITPWDLQNIKNLFYVINVLTPDEERIPELKIQFLYEKEV